MPLLILWSLPLLLPQLWRYYLVPIAARQPMFELDLEGGEVYVLDAKTASVRCCPVHRLAPPGTPPQELRLRIRCGEAGSRVGAEDVGGRDTAGSCRRPFVRLVPLSCLACMRRPGWFAGMSW